MGRKVSEYARFMDYVRALSVDASVVIAELAIDELREFLKPR